MLSQTDISDADAAVSGGGYESDREDTDPDADDAGQDRQAGLPTAAVLAVAASPDGCAACTAFLPSFSPA